MNITLNDLFWVWADGGLAAAIAVYALTFTPKAPFKLRFKSSIETKDASPEQRWAYLVVVFAFWYLLIAAWAWDRFSIARKEDS